MSRTTTSVATAMEEEIDRILSDVAASSDGEDADISDDSESIVPLALPRPSEIVTRPEVYPLWYHRRLRNRRESPICRLSNELLHMIFAHLTLADHGCLRATCSRFLHFVSQKSIDTPIADYGFTRLEGRQAATPWAMLQRSRFNLWPVHAPAAARELSVPDRERQEAEAAAAVRIWRPRLPPVAYAVRAQMGRARVEREMCWTCRARREMWFVLGLTAFDRPRPRRHRHYCEDCRMEQPASAFSVAELLLFSPGRCRMKEATLPLCEHATRLCWDIARAADAAIGLRKDRGIDLSRASCRANAAYGLDVDLMSTDHSLHRAFGGSGGVPPWLLDLDEHRPTLPLPVSIKGVFQYMRSALGVRRTTTRQALRAAEARTKQQQEDVRCLMVEDESEAEEGTSAGASADPNMAYTHSARPGVYADIFRCHHPSHQMAAGTAPATYDGPRIEMSHAVAGYPNIGGRLTMIWSGHMFDIPEVPVGKLTSNKGKAKDRDENNDNDHATAAEELVATGLTRSVLRGIIASLDPATVPTLCPHVRRLGMVQLALAFEENQCACFDAARDVTDPAQRPPVASRHPWNLADNASASAYSSSKVDGCMHRPGYARCCRCYNDRQYDVHQTSPRTLMPEWREEGEDDESRKPTPPALHSYRCNQCATEYRWQRRARRLFLETRKEIVIPKDDWTTVPRAMFTQFVDPSTMRMHPGCVPRGHDYWCSDETCLTRTQPWWWQTTMQCHPQEYVGQEVHPE